MCMCLSYLLWCMLSCPLRVRTISDFVSFRVSKNEKPTREGVFYDSTVRETWLKYYYITTMYFIFYEINIVYDGELSKFYVYKFTFESRLSDR